VKEKELVLDGAGLGRNRSVWKGNPSPQKVKNERVWAQKRKRRELTLIRDKRTREWKVGIQVDLALDTQMGLTD